MSTSLTVSQPNSGSIGLTISMPITAETTAPSVRIHGYSPALEVLDKDMVQNYYFGLDDNDGNRGCIGDGYGPGQGITPTLSWEPTTHRVMFNGSSGDADAKLPYLPSPNTMYGQVNIKSMGDVGLWIRQIGGADTALVLESFDQNGGLKAGPIVYGISHRGTPVSPGATQANDHLMILDGRGDDGVITTDTSAQISMWAAENWNAGAHGSYIGFWTTPTGSIAPKERLRIRSNGDLEMYEISAPGSGAPNSCRIYVDDSAGKTRLMAQFSSGPPQQIAIQP